MTKKQSDLIPKPKSRFLKVLCTGCGNEQVIFSAAASKVNCLVCNQELAQTGASNIKIKTKILKVFE